MAKLIKGWSNYETVTVAELVAKLSEYPSDMRQYGLTIQGTVRELLEKIGAS